MNQEVTTNETEESSFQDYKNARFAKPDEVTQDVEDGSEADESTVDDVPIEETQEEANSGKRKPKLEQRFSELTSKARAAEERARVAEERLRELESTKSKSEQSTAKDEETEPESKDYTDAFEYARDLAKWTTAKALKDRDIADQQKQVQKERESVVKQWESRLEAAKAELPDFDEVVEAATDLTVSDPIRDALIESEVGPKLLHHLAANPDVLDAINKLSIPAQLRAFGKLEAKFEAPVIKKEVAPVKRAPEPIFPIRSKTVSNNKINEKGEFTGTAAEYRALRAAGKI